MKHISKTVKLVVLTAVGGVILGLTPAAVMARSDVPPPYSGARNPYSWSDVKVQDQGKKVYAKACSACHGVGGDNLASSNFAASGYSGKLESEADYYFWIVSEGRLSNGMPPFKSSLSDDERWQVLTYIWSLSQPGNTTATPPKVPAARPTDALALTVGDRTLSPELLLAASLSDVNGKPVADRDIKFFLKKDFFASAWMEIGEAATNKDGKATLQYIPKETGEIQVMARDGELEASRAWTVKTAGKTYQAVAGIDLPTLGPEVNVGTTLAIGPVEMMETPTGGMRLPGGTLSWLLLFVGAIVLIWATYFRVFRQIMLIPEGHAGEGSSVKLIPFAAMAFVLIVGAVLAIVILHGPYTHLHLLR